METMISVRPGHLNAHGFLFGGQMLAWVDEFAWMAAAREYPGCRLVTVAFDKASFRKQVLVGSILRFAINRVRTGHTSVAYKVEVFATCPCRKAEEQVFDTNVTFVNVDADGTKRTLPVGNR